MNKKLTFDYIVVGSGPAGAVIAKTLTDNKKTPVLVLEAVKITINISRLGILRSLWNFINDSDELYIS